MYSKKISIATLSSEEDINKDLMRFCQSFPGLTKKIYQRYKEEKHSYLTSNSQSKEKEKSKRKGLELDIDLKTLSLDLLKALLYIAFFVITLISLITLNPADVFDSKFSIENLLKADQSDGNLYIDDKRKLKTDIESRLRDFFVDIQSGSFPKRSPASSKINMVSSMRLSFVMYIYSVPGKKNRMQVQRAAPAKRGSEMLL